MINMLFEPTTAENAESAAPVDVTSFFSMPHQASTFAESTDGLYKFVVTLDFLFFAAIMSVAIYFAWTYRRQSKDQKTSSLTHSGLIEFLWSAIPAVLLIIIFIWGEIDYVRQSTPPADPLRVNVIGRTWAWDVSYPDYPGVELHTDNEGSKTALVVPTGRPVQLTLTSKDVIHSFFIPAFRIKKDVVPGRYTNMWFEAKRPGRFNLFCAEFCGDSHSRMIGAVEVVKPDEFEARLQKLYEEASYNLTELKPAEYGEKLATLYGCTACHSTDGTRKTGPSWKGLFGKQETLATGETVTVDAEYIRTAVYEPNAQIVAGFEGVNMPSYAGQIKDATQAKEIFPDNPDQADQLAAIIAYIQSL